MITDESKQLLLQQYYDRGILKKEIRSYEVSLWTLQDEFITVLKWSDVEQKGRIEKPIMILKTDGTQTLNFSIPMYVWYMVEDDEPHLEKRENPIWYNTQNGNIIANLRKIKVIINKWTEDEGVFEFVITSVQESHENDVLTCELDCEGLAFHELGKIGYKINLSDDTFLDVYSKWEETQTGTEPLENIDFWCGEHGIGLTKWENNITQNSTEWYYKVDMNWDSFVNGIARDSTKIYEEPYTSDWNDNLVPIAVENYKEKERPISAENSNIYNITQTIAETFEVYCRYEYGYDDNYHINSRTIVFYNNFAQEDKMFSLTYPYSSQRVTRTMEGNDLVTKLFVLDTETSMNVAGYNSITNTSANFMMEDYILNFDYLYQTRGITEEQYQAINQFQKDIRAVNKELIPLYNQLNKYQSEKPEAEGKLTYYKNSIDAAKDQIDQTTDLLEALDAKDGSVNGTITVDNNHPDTGFIITDTTNGNYINLTTTNKGIVSETVKLYRTYNTTTHTLSNALSNFYFEYDEYGNPIKIKGVTPNGGSGMVYMTYDYSPQFYYTSVLQVWQDKIAADQANYDIYEDLVDEINETIEDLEEELDETLDAKKQLIKNFERMLGPALREGYWQPEDYSDYGSRINTSKTFTSTYNSSFYGADTQNDYMIGWDNVLFDEEERLYYKVGVNLQTKYYPCILLNTVFNNNIPTDIDQYSFIFNKIYSAAADLNNIQLIQMFNIGSEAFLRFIKNNSNNTIIPVLVLTGTKTMRDEEITDLLDSAKGHPRLAKVTTTVNSATGNVTLTMTNTKTLYNANQWVSNVNNYRIVYPRAKFSSLDLEPDNMVIHYNNTLLQNYYDYQILTRINSDDSETGQTGTGALETIVTIKPETMFKLGTYTGQINIAYTISNANIEIYLDALKVSKENAWPKVSYEITPNLLDTSLSRILYQKLAQLVMINDHELKFENVFGYVSSVTLDLDNIQNDSIEIKNYKTKFEDLFSNIVASTEAMKQVEGRLGAAINGNIPLSAEAWSQSLSNPTNINFLENYLNEYFDTSPFVDDKLRSLFTEAGEILAGANQTLNSMTALTVANSNILSSFASNVAQELTVIVTKGQTRPENFKVGDIWLQTNNSGTIIGRYVATMNSKDLVQESSSNPTAGFVRTYDGSLANIAGASLSIDTVDGTIDLLAQNSVTLGANTVNITGSNAVNIGGTTVNIGSTSTTTQDYGGINLVAAAYNDMSGKVGNTSYAQVSITPQKIFMAASELEMKAASTINLYASTGTVAGTSAIKIDANEGVWIGSGKSLTLFSGAAGTGASIELNTTHLLLGYGNVSSQSTSASAMEFTQDYIILAVGKNISSSTNVTGQSGGLVGAKLTKDSIGFATATNAIVMNGNGITLGSWSSGNSAYDLSSSTIGTTIQGENKGSYVHIAGDGLTIASGGNLYVNTANFKVNTNSSTVFAVGNTFGTLAEVSAYTSNSTASWVNSWTSGMIYNSNGFFVKGSGSFSGDISATSLIAESSVGIFKATGNTLGFYNGNNPIFTISNGQNTTDIMVYGNLKLGTGGSFSIDVSNQFKINSTNLVVDPDPTTGNPYFRLGTAASPVLNYTGSTFTISTTSFKLLTDNLKLDSTAINNGGIMLYIANGANWDDSGTTSGMRFVVGSGLEVKGKISGDSVIGDTNVNFSTISGLPSRVGDLESALGDISLSSYITHEEWITELQPDITSELGDVEDYYDAEIRRIDKDISDIQQLISQLHGGQSIDPGNSGYDVSGDGN